MFRITILIKCRASVLETLAHVISFIAASRNETHWARILRITESRSAHRLAVVKLPDAYSCYDNGELIKSAL